MNRPHELLDKRRVAASFDRAAQTYEAHDFLQREVAARALERLASTARALQTHCTPLSSGLFEPQSVSGSSGCSIRARPSSRSGSSPQS